MKVLAFAWRDAIVQSTIEFPDKYSLRLRLIDSNLSEGTPPVFDMCVPKGGQSGLCFDGKKIRLREIVEIED